METPLSVQTAVFARACLFGGALGLFWDVLRGARRAFRLKKRGTAVLDGLFCLSAAAALLLFLLIGTDGALRSYLVLGIGLGFLLWRLTLSRGAARLSAALWGAAARGCRAAAAAAVWLFSFPRGT